MGRQVVVIDLVGAAPGHFEEPALFPGLAALFAGGAVRPLRPVFPAVTCPAQVTMLTGTPPSEHGIVANGLFGRGGRGVTMWTWPAGRIERPLVWELLRKQSPAARTAVFFFQGLKGTSADVYVNPHPRHTADGKTLPWCDSKPEGLYERLTTKFGHFPLHAYWGPMARIESSKWILTASRETISELKPDLSLVYVPHLDYVGQRCGPDSGEFASEARLVDQLVAEFIVDVRTNCALNNPAILLLSEYAFRPVKGGVLPNVALREAGLLNVREDAGAEHLASAASTAFAVADHQVAHVYASPDAVPDASAALRELEGVAEVCGPERIRELGIHHRNTGELVLLSKPNRWFAYPWWTDPGRVPDFARTVDIHRKPGYDPLELFFAPDRRGIAQDTDLVRGSHGLSAEETGECGVLGVLDAVTDGWRATGAREIANLILLLTAETEA